MLFLACPEPADISTTNMTEAEVVTADMATLTDTQLATTIGEALNSITKDFNLPTTGTNGSTISWAVKSGSGIVLIVTNKETAAVTRPTTVASTGIQTYIVNGLTPGTTYYLGCRC